MKEANFDNEDKFDEVADEDDEELLQPTWKKPTFGVQLEAPTRYMTLSIAAITKTKVKTVVTEMDGPFQDQPFLDAMYDVGNMLLPNPWSATTTILSESESKQDTKSVENGSTLIDQKLDIKNSETDARPIGFIPYIEEAPPVAEPKLEDSTDQDDPKPSNQKTDSKSDQISFKDEASYDKFERVVDDKSSASFNTRK